MRTLVTSGGDVFEAGCDTIDVTSLHRPDTSWTFTDANGHEHRWFADGKTAKGYRPDAKHTVPSLVWVHDDWGYYEDGERYEIGHHECSQCREHVEPRYTADTTTQHITGLRWYRINGVPVQPDEFQRRMADMR